MKLYDNESAKFCVYKITNLINNKIYIGKTCNFENRWYEHVRVAKTKEKTSYYLHKSINKYGAENFKIEIIENNLTEEQSLEREKFWIKILNSKDPNIGMNLTDGGEGTSGLKWTEESRDKKRGKNNPNFGKNISKQMQDKNPDIFNGINNGFYGKTHSTETINFLKNRDISPEIKNIISENCRGAKQWNAKFSNDDIIEIRRKWDNKECSQAELARIYGVKRNTINQIVNRKRWTHI